MVSKIIEHEYEPLINPEEEVDFISERYLESGYQGYSKENIEKVLNLYYYKLSQIDPDPVKHYKTMERKLNFSGKFIKLIWGYQLEFLISKGIAI